LLAISLTVARYKNEVLIKNEFKSGSYLQDKSKITKELLGILLPQFVLEKIDNFEITDYKIGEDLGDITVLFCDIADFDGVIKDSEDDIVRILDSVFRKFDELCMVHGLQKIETVGKTYMAAGGLKYIEDNLPSSIKVKNSTVRILDFAKDMNTVIKTFEGLKLKIGIHYGRCTMGVIGWHKP
jgi:class 3 adenylate cyclase